MTFRDRSVVYQVLGVVLLLGLLTGTPISGVTFAEELTGVRLLEEIQNVFINLAERVKPAVVNISPVSVSTKSSESPRERGQNNPGTGSGVIVDKDGIVVTNNHVVGDAKAVEVRLSDTSKYVGQWIMAVGNPFSLDRTVTVGVVSGLERDAVRLSRYEAFIQTDASINPGNSGGPLFNIKGEVIGINTAIINYAQGIGFAIPSNMVQQVVTQLRAHGKVVRGWLGVGIQEVTAELAAKFGIKETDGILVNDVFENEPAARAGLKPGDIIAKVG